MITIKEIGEQVAGLGGKVPMEFDWEFLSLKGNRKLAIKEVAGAYTVTARDTGKILLCTAAATITLPAPAAGWDGVYVDVYVGGAGAVTVVTATVDTLVAGNDLTADSLAWATATEIIGNAGRFFCYGSKWYAINHIALEAFTTTIAT